MSTLDRVFVSVDWEGLFPGAAIKALPRLGSDHTPLVLNTSIGPTTSSSKFFRFEKWWLDIPCFDVVIQKAWNTKCKATKAIDIWQFKIRTTRKAAKGWCANYEADQNRTKQALVAE